ncbi:MAG: ricin-type beta-trefoil lectin domain protein [Acidobacteriaceae bacterium]
MIAAGVLLTLVAGSVCARAAEEQPLAPVPPMGWNDWAHYQCGFTAQTILENARALVKTGLAARGYNTVTIDDCWMQKDRDAEGNLQADPGRFPNGMKPVADAVHALGLKFGIYEDSGWETCGRFAGSGEPKGGGADHFLQDAKLFASWGVDYLKLDGCNVYVPQKGEENAAYRKAYAAEAAALKQVGRPIVFSESAPAYFQGTPDWYDVLTWVREYGQLWREGTDIEIFRKADPDRSRFKSMQWNYSYNLPLGRFQRPGNWNDADFIIGGDDGLTVAESRTQMALWSMMSAPLILSSDLSSLSKEAIGIVGNKAVIAVDQDPLGKMATLVRRSATTDVLFKTLSGGEYAVAAFNRGTTPLDVTIQPADLGFSANCRFDARELWTGKHQSKTAELKANVATHDTAMWKIRPEAGCGTPPRMGTITMITTGEENRDIADYGLCMAASGRTESCTGNSDETWTVSDDGALQSGGQCLAVAEGKVAMQACSAGAAQKWNYNLVGNLINASDHQCLSSNPGSGPDALSIQACGNNLPNQIWSLPN